MTQKQLMERFVRGDDIPEPLNSGSLEATQQKLWWPATGPTSKSGKGRALAYRGNGVVLVGNVYDRARPHRNIHKGIASNQCNTLLALIGRHNVDAINMNLLPMEVKSTGLGCVVAVREALIYNAPRDSVHTKFAALCWDAPNTDWAFDFYTKACRMLGIDPLFPCAEGLMAWHSLGQSA